MIAAGLFFAPIFIDRNESRSQFFADAGKGGAAAHRNLRAFKELARHPNTSPQWIETRKKWLVSWELCSISHVLTQAAHTSQQKATITTTSLRHHPTKNRDRKMCSFMRNDECEDNDANPDFSKNMKNLGPQSKCCKETLFPQTDDPLSHVMSRPVLILVSSRHAGVSTKPGKSCRPTVWVPFTFNGSSWTYWFLSPK